MEVSMVMAIAINKQQLLCYMFIIILVFFYIVDLNGSVHNLKHFFYNVEFKFEMFLMRMKKLAGFQLLTEKKFNLFQLNNNTPHYHSNSE